jgi:hypothetical protein
MSLSIESNSQVWRELIWARMPGWPHWPARRSTPSEVLALEAREERPGGDNKSTPAKKVIVPVIFFGSVYQRSPLLCFIVNVSLTTVSLVDGLLRIVSKSFQFPISKSYLMLRPLKRIRNILGQFSNRSESLTQSHCLNIPCDFLNRSFRYIFHKIRCLSCSRLMVFNVVLVLSSHDA